MTLLETNLKQSIGESFGFIEITDTQTTMYVDILKLPHQYLLDFDITSNPDTNVWQRTVDRRGHQFIIYYKLDAELLSSYDVNNFTIDRLNADITKIILKQG